MTQTVFVSHAGRDLAWAEWVAWQLRDAGYEVELDRWDWAAGDNFVLRMSAALERASLVVAVVSKAYFESGRFTDDEWSPVIATRGRLVLLRVEEAQVAAILRPYIFRDLYGIDEAAARRTLLQAAAGPAGPPSHAPAFPGSTSATGSISATSAADTPRSDGPRLPGTLPPVWNIPIRNAVYTGRDGLLSDLRDGFLGGARLQALHGIGGAGKSTLAIEYVYRFANGYDVAWWIDATETGRIAEQFAALAAAAGWAPADAGTPAGLAQAAQHLRNMSRWLLIFDNADDAGALSDQLPPGLGGHLIVTSRNPGWRQLGTPVAVDVFARAESVALLRSLTPAIAEVPANAIAEALGDLPLAVAQAAGVLAENAYTPEQYLRELAGNADELMSDGTPVGYPVPLAAAVGVSLHRLAAEDEAAIQLARYCAALAPEPIPIAVLAEAPAGVLPEPLAGVVRSTVALNRVIARLGRYGLARVSDSTIQLHRLTQAIVAASDPDRAGTRREVAALLAAGVPGDMGDEPATWPRWAQLLPHLLAHLPAADPAGDEDLRSAVDRAAWYLFARGELHAGLAVAETLHDLWLRAPAPDISALTTLAEAYRGLGRYADARRLDEQALARSRRFAGDDDFTTLAAGGNLAADLLHLGEFRAAFELNEEVLGRLERLVGADDPATLASANNLAEALARLGDYQRARELNEEILARRQRLLGPGHPSALATAANLAGNLRELGRSREALVIDEDTLAHQRRILGPDHPDTLASANNVATDLQDLGDLHRARDLHEDTLARQRRVLGEEHPETISSRENLGLVRQALGET